MCEDSKDAVVGGLILIILASIIAAVFIFAKNGRAEYELAEQKAVKWIQANCNKGSKLVASRNELRRVYTCNGTDYTLSMLTSQFMEK